LFTTYQEKDGAIIKAEVLAEGENILMLPGGAEISFSTKKPKSEKNLMRSSHQKKQ